MVGPGGCGRPGRERAHMKDLMTTADPPGYALPGLYLHRCFGGPASAGNSTGHSGAARWRACSLPGSPPRALRGAG